MADKLYSELSKGTYAAETAYTIGDFVDYSGSSYVCIANSTGNLPTDTDYWALIASKGDIGDTGATGDTGPQGDPGPFAGPESSTDENIVVFDGTDGDTGKDGGETIAEVKAASIPVGDAPSGDIVGTTDTQTLTNKRVTKRVTTITSNAEPTVNTDNCDVVTITALGEAITSMTTNLSGTPTNFQGLIFRILDNGTGRAITWGDSFQAMGTDLPTTTTASKVLTVGFLYDTVDSKWGCVVSVEES